MWHHLPDAALLRAKTYPQGRMKDGSAEIQMSPKKEKQEHLCEGSSSSVPTIVHSCAKTNCAVCYGGKRFGGQGKYLSLPPTHQWVSLGLCQLSTWCKSKKSKGTCREARKGTAFDASRACQVLPFPISLPCYALPPAPFFLPCHLTSIGRPSSTTSAQRAFV